MQRDVLIALRRLGRTHAYELKKRLSNRSVFAAIVALQAKGWVDAEWEENPHPGFPPRKMLWLTGEGSRIAIRQVVTESREGTRSGQSVAPQWTLPLDGVRGRS